MMVRLLAFARLRDLLGFQERLVECAAAETPRVIMQRIAPELELGAVRVAVDEEYASWDEPIGPAATEVALIPPVSGG